MDAVDVVAGDDVACHLADVVAILWDAGIEYEQVVVGEAAHRLAYGDMVCCQLLGGLGLGPVGIDPGMQLHAALVTLCDHPLQGIPVGHGSLPLLSCQETAPRLQTALVEGIALGPYLEDDDVDAVFLQFIELVAQCLLHLLGAKPLELAVDTLNPSTTELTFGLGLGVG